MPTSDVVLAIDVNSSRIKAALIDEQGAALHAVRHPSPLALESCAPETMWQAVLGTIHALIAAAKGYKVQALAVTGAPRCHVLLDRKQQPLGHIVPHGFSASQSSAWRVAEAYGARQGAHTSVYHPLARLVDLMDKHAQLRQQPVNLLELRDWINLRLSGRLVTDTVSAARLAGPGRWAWDEEYCALVLERLGLKEAHFPIPLSPADVLGAVSTEQCPDVLAGIPVVTGSHETWCTSVGLGAVKAGGRFLESASQEVMGGISEHAHTIPGLLTQHWGGALYASGGPTQCGARTLRWVARKLLQLDPAAEIFRHAAQGQSTSNLPLFLPYRYGERAPIWRSQVAHGLYDHQPDDRLEDHAAAVLVGIACANRYLLDRLPDARGAIRIGGGTAHYPLWCQIKADVIGASVEHIAQEHLSLSGAGLTAWTAIGRYPDLQSAQAAIAVAHRFDPAPDGRYEALYKRFVDRLDGELRADASTRFETQTESF